MISARHIATALFIACASYFPSAFGGITLPLPIIGTCLSQPTLSPLNLSCQIVQLSSEAVRPLSFTTLTLPTNVAGSIVKQLSGPPVTELKYGDGVLSFISPADTGKVVQMSFQIGPNVLRQYVVQLGSVQPDLISEVGDSSNEEGTSAQGSKLNFEISGLIYGNVLPALSAASSLSFKATATSGTGFGPALPSITLITDDGTFDVSKFFQLSNSKRVMSMKAGSGPDIQKLLATTNRLEISGTDDWKRNYAFQVQFFRGDNALSIQTRTQDGSTFTPPSARLRYALRGLNTGMNALLTPSADGGTLQLGSLPDDAYELAVIDPDQQVFGSALFAIHGSGVNGNLSFVVYTTDSLTKAKTLFANKSSETIYTQDRQNNAAPQRLSPPTPQRFSASAAASDAGIVYGEAVASSSGQGVTHSDKKTFSIPISAGTIKIRATIDSSEYPDWTTNPDNPFDDQWSYAWSCAGLSDAKSGRVNVTHNTTGSISFEKTIALPKDSGGAAVSCTVYAAATDIGDGIFPTRTRVQVSSLTPDSLSLSNVQHLSGLFQGKTKRYYLGIPIGTEGTRRPITLKFSYTPVDASLHHLLLKLRYGSLSHDLPAITNLTKLSPGIAQATFTLPLLHIVPDGNRLATITAQLVAQTEAGEVISSETQMTLPGGAPEQLAPLFEVRHAYGSNFVRYESRNDSDGGDGWGQVKLLNWVAAQGKNLDFNDLSGEHAWQSGGKSMGIHDEHKDGLDIDARYKDENGRFDGPMRGDSSAGVDGKAILDVINAAKGEVTGNASAKPQLTKLVHWIKQNRKYLSAVSTNKQVLSIYTGNQIWHQNALWFGKFPDGSPIPDVDAPPPTAGSTNPVLPSWTDKPPKIRAVGKTHQSHFHVSFD